MIYILGTLMYYSEERDRNTPN